MALAAEGTQVLDEVWTEVVPYIPKKEHADVALRLVKIFEDNDVVGISSESEYAVLRKASRDLNGETGESEDEGQD